MPHQQQQQQQQQGMAEVPRHKKAFIAMRALGVDDKTTETVLKNLLKVYKNWEPIEEENYRVLADVIFEDGKNQVEEARKRKESQSSSDYERQPKKLNSTQQESRASHSGGYPLQSSGVTPRRSPESEEREIAASQPFPRGRLPRPVPSSPGLVTRDTQNGHNISQTHNRRNASPVSQRSHFRERGNNNEPKPTSSRLWSRDRTNEPKSPQTHTRCDVNELKPVSQRSHFREQGKDNVSSSQNSMRQDVAGASSSCPRANRPNSSSVSPQARQKLKGKEPIIHQNGKKVNREIFKEVSMGLSFKEPKVENGYAMVPSNYGYNALSEITFEPYINHNPEFEVPVAVVRSLNQYPAVNDGAADMSTAGHSNGLTLELANVPNNIFSNFEIASSPLGEVTISLSCKSSSGCPDIHMPNLQEVLKLAEDMAENTRHRSHKIIEPNFSLAKLMEELCQCFLQLATNRSPTDDIQAIVCAEGIHPGYLQLALSSSNGCRNGLVDHPKGQISSLFLEWNGARNEEKHQHCSESSNSSRSMLAQHHQLNRNGRSSSHNVEDICKGEEGVKIPVVNGHDSELPPFFHYMTGNTIYQNAYINISLARVGDEDSCSTCYGNCVSSPIPCACARETGGDFAYTADGTVKREFLDECIKIGHDQSSDRLYFCKDCPLERSNCGLTKCKGHLLRKFIKECWIKCGCSKQCGNRLVQRGITCNLQVFFTPQGKGWGLRTVNNLPRGAFVCEYVGEILTNTELYNRNDERTGTEKHTYPVLLDADWGSEGVLQDEEALCLDATYYGNVARFINHRCFDSNLVEIPVEIETPDRHYYHVAFFTSREVGAMEELAWDYGIDFHDINHPIKAFKCLCGSKFCRDMPCTGMRR
ncbi:hypothetical protein IFM89_016881 [Coptis chinensis]|uniref:Uncharacterized protein n=1 Tax=Coptis chinensis TaxID=261450 RepID=A0A835LVY3_9MAGN|nr:hypothetical protein IFM89_016881 [Coptis chinensis]